MPTTQDLLKLLDDFENTPESAGHALRLDLAELILKTLQQKCWTQKQLAQIARMKPSFITRIVHGSSNCTFDVAGRLLFALGIKARMAESPASAAGQPAVHSAQTTSSFTYKSQLVTYAHQEKTVRYTAASTAGHAPSQAPARTCSTVLRIRAQAG